MFGSKVALSSVGRWGLSLVWLLCCCTILSPSSCPAQRQGLKTVQSLNLSWNRIDDDGCLPIARLLGPLSQLAINKSVREKAAAALVKVRTS